MLGKLAALAVAVLLALGAGYGLGYLVFQPRLDSLRGTQEEQAGELEAVKTQLSQKGTSLEDTLEELGDVKAEGAGMTAELQATSATLSRVKGQLGEAQTSLESTQADLSTRAEDLETAEAQVEELRQQVAALEAAQKDLGDAVKVQAEIMAIVSEKLGPTLGDADLLARRGLQARDQQNYDNAVLFFEDASAAYAEAKEEAEATPEMAKKLVSLVPEDERDSFSRAHKHVEGRLRAVSSRVPEFQAAANLYRVIAEWDEQFEPDEEERTSSAEDIERWGKIVDEAEAQIDEAMTLLDEAVEWAPDLWREFEVQRIQVQGWRRLVDGVRFTILEV